MKRLMLIIPVFLVFMLFAACDESDDSSDLYSFDIFSTGNSFVTRYKVDNDPYIILPSTYPTYDGSYYYHVEVYLDNPTSIAIRANGIEYSDNGTPGDTSDDTTATTSLHIEVFKDGYLIDEDYKTKSTEDEIIEEARVDINFNEDTSEE